MNKLKLKVCGMRDPKNIQDVAALKPDFMGFIFYQASKRYVGEDFAVPKNFSVNIKRVGVFVNETVENIITKVSRYKLDFVQLHGDESPEICKSLRSKIKVIKVFRIDDSFDFKLTKEFNSCVDFFLFDTKGENYGGTGKTFDWRLLKKYDQQISFFLSGGLSPGNIMQVKELIDLNLYGLDFNSQVESASGLKDINKLNSIFSILNSHQDEIHS